MSVMAAFTLASFPQASLSSSGSYFTPAHNICGLRTLINSPNKHAEHSSYSPYSSSTRVVHMRARSAQQHSAHCPAENVLRLREKCILVGVHITSRSARDDTARLFSLSDSLSELGRLASTAGMEVMGEVTQTLETPFAGTYIGTGKVAEVHRELDAAGCKTVVFDVELSPAQQRTLESAFGGEAAGIKVLDRTALILDIFAQRALSREGQLQVELALYQYRLPRLTRMWTHLERQSGAGGVGLRGPGETQIESDRRQINVRIAKLRRELELVRAHRTRQRRARRAQIGIPAVALVGYTNAGKSTLLNALTGADAFAEDSLFATLDPKTRRANIQGVKLGPEMLLTDTVGFVQNLPTQLVAAFRGTLEEVQDADALVHVVDGSLGDELLKAQMEAVYKVLTTLDAAEKPGLVVMNKIDCVRGGDLEIERKMNVARSVAHGLDVIAVSAKMGTGTQLVCAMLDDVLRDAFVKVEALVPYDRGDLLAMVYEQGAVEAEDFGNNGTRVVASVSAELAAKLRPFACGVSFSKKGRLRKSWTDLARRRHLKHDVTEAHSKLELEIDTEVDMDMDTETEKETVPADIGAAKHTGG